MILLFVKPKKVWGMIIHPFDCYIGDEKSNQSWTLLTSRWANPTSKNDDDSIVTKYLVTQTYSAASLRSYKARHWGPRMYFPQCHGHILLKVLTDISPTGDHQHATLLCQFCWLLVTPFQFLQTLLPIQGKQV